MKILKTCYNEDPYCIPITGYATTGGVDEDEPVNYWVENLFDAFDGSIYCTRDN